MNIAQHMRPDRSLLLVLSGELDIASAPALRDVGVRLAREGGCERILIDMVDVSFMDSCGINALIAISNAAHESGVSTLVDPSDRVHRLLQITALDTVFEIEQSEHASDEDDLERAD